MSRSTSLVYRRYSFLKRAPVWTRSEFSRYYEHHHGPLAAGLCGFRKFATRYVQNHVEDLPNGAEPLFDGVTITTQVPRDDYSRGFREEPDFKTVKLDEQYLFDLAKTVSVLGWQNTIDQGKSSPYKALIVASQQAFHMIRQLQPTALVLNHLDPSTASAFRSSAPTFDYDLLVEAWFADEAARDEAFIASRSWPTKAAPTLFLPVREVVVFGPEKPWTVN